MTPAEHDDIERDAWLTEALRHAPDADAAPPMALRETILRQARAASVNPRVAPAVGLVPRLLAAWSWLARPPVAAGFASVMVATLVGLMWWDRPMDETLPRPPLPAPASVPAPDVQRPEATAPAPAAEPTGETVSATADRAAPAKERVATAAPTPPTSPARADKAAARAIAPPAPQPAEADRAEPAAFGDERKTQATAPAPAPAPAPALAAAPTARMRESASTSTTDTPAAAARDESTMPSASPAARALAKAAPPPSTSGALASAQQRESRTQATPLAALLAAVTDHPQRWRWQRNAEAQAMSPALQRWLLQLDRATAPQWRAADSTMPPAEAASLRLYRDDALHTTLQFDADAVWLTPAAPGAHASRAALPPATLADLKRTLADAAP